jgi:hypothetical protein
MSREDELRDILKDTANELSHIQSSPRTWLSWMVYLLARLEEKATDQNPGNKDAYLSMLSALQNEIKNRLRTGGWN